jgi:hypothetical protein
MSFDVTVWCIVENIHVDETLTESNFLTGTVTYKKFLNLDLEPKRLRTTALVNGDGDEGGVF